MVGHLINPNPDPNPSPNPNLNPNPNPNRNPNPKPNPKPNPNPSSPSDISQVIPVFSRETENGADYIRKDLGMFPSYSEIDY